MRAESRPAVEGVRRRACAPACGRCGAHGARMWQRPKRRTVNGGAATPLPRLPNWQRRRKTKPGPFRRRLLCNPHLRFSSSACCACSSSSAQGRMWLPYSCVRLAPQLSPSLSLSVFPGASESCLLSLFFFSLFFADHRSPRRLAPPPPRRPPHARAQAAQQPSAAASAAAEMLSRTALRRPWLRPLGRRMSAAAAASPHASARVVAFGDTVWTGAARAAMPHVPTVLGTLGTPSKFSPLVARCFNGSAKITTSGSTSRY